VTTECKTAFAVATGVGRIFSRDGPIVHFPGEAKNIFAVRPKVTKVYFNHSQLWKQPFFGKNLMEKCQISKFKGVPWPLLPPFRQPWLWQLFIIDFLNFCKPAWQRRI